MAVILTLERILHAASQLLAIFATWSMIKEYIGLSPLTTAIHMEKYRTTILVFLSAFAIEFIDFHTTLFQTFDLIEWNRIAHTCLPFAILQIIIITDTVFLILDDNMYFGTFLHQITRQAQGYIIGILIFMQLMAIQTPYSPWIGTTMSTDNVKASTVQATARHIDMRKFLAEQGFLNLPLFSSNRLFSSLFQRRKHITYSQYQFFLAFQFLFIQPQEFTVISLSGTMITLQK